MRISPPWLTAILFLLIFQVIAQKEGNAPATVYPDRGSFRDGKYQNKFFDFTYVPPSHLKVDTGAFEGALPSGGKDPERRSYVLLSAKEEPRHGKAAVEGVVIIADDVSFYRTASRTPDYLQKVTLEFKKLGAEVLQEPVEVTVGGQEFWRVDYRNPGSGGVLAAIYGIRGRFAVGFLFTSRTPAGLKQLVDSLKTVQFNPDGSANEM